MLTRQRFLFKVHGQAKATHTVDLDQIAALNKPNLALFQPTQFRALLD
jgi:hypothetical protein